MEAMVGRWAEGGSLRWAVPRPHGQVTSVPMEALAQHSLVLSPVPHFMCSVFVPPDPVLCSPRVAPACRAWKIREEHWSSQGRGEEHQQHGGEGTGRPRGAGPRQASWSKEASLCTLSPLCTCTKLRQEGFLLHTFDEILRRHHHISFLFK